MPMPRPLKPPPRVHHEKNGFFYWKPAARLRQQGGFRTTALGTEIRAAYAAAQALNKKADAWLASAGGVAMKKASPGTAGASAHGLTFGQLVERYRASHAFDGLRATTRKTYGWCLNILAAEFAHERAAMLGRARVLEWAEPLAKKSPQGFRHYRAVGRRLYEWGMARDQVTIEANPFHKLPLAVPIGRRGKRVLEADLKLLVAEADRAGRQDIGTTMVLAFFAVQRLSDVLRLTTVNLHASGLRLRLTQSKTGRELDFVLAQPIVARLAAHPPKARQGGQNSPPSLTGLYAEDLDCTARHAFDHIRKRLIKAAMATPEKHPGLAARLTGLQLRDMRRSGFCFYAEKPGVTVHQICSISGHTVAEGMEIVETYLPKTPEQADMAITLAGAKW